MAKGSARRTKVPDDAMMLLGLGWEPVRKGVDTMLEALALVRSAGRSAVLVLVGTDDRLQSCNVSWTGSPTVP